MEIWLRRWPRSSIRNTSSHSHRACEITDRSFAAEPASRGDHPGGGVPCNKAAVACPDSGAGWRRNRASDRGAPAEVNRAAVAEQQACDSLMRLLEILNDLRVLLEAFRLSHFAYQHYLLSETLQHGLRTAVMSTGSWSRIQPQYDVVECCATRF